MCDYMVRRVAIHTRRGLVAPSANRVLAEALALIYLHITLLTFSHAGCAQPSTHLRAMPSNMCRLTLLSAERADLPALRVLMDQFKSAPFP